MRLLAVALLLSAFSLPALAGNGVLEINQACATNPNTGCFPGDFPGFPVTINVLSDKSYRLTSDLTVPDEFTSAIVLLQSRVSIDLNGFEIRRADCLGPCSISDSGTGHGVEASFFGAEGISVKNGSISGMGGSGVRAAGELTR